MKIIDERKTQKQNKTKQKNKDSKEQGGQKLEWKGES